MFLCLPLAFSSLSMSSLLCSLRRTVVRFRACPKTPVGSHLKILNLITSVKMFFPNMIKFTGSGWKDVDIPFGGGGHHSTHYTASLNSGKSLHLHPQFMCVLLGPCSYQQRCGQPLSVSHYIGYVGASHFGVNLHFSDYNEIECFVYFFTIGYPLLKVPI